MLPEHDVVIVDEAHELVDRVTGVATAELTAAMVERAARVATRVADERAVGHPARGRRGARRDDGERRAGPARARAAAAGRRARGRPGRRPRGDRLDQHVPRRRRGRRAGEAAGAGRRGGDLRHRGAAGRRLRVRRGVAVARGTARQGAARGAVVRGGAAARGACSAGARSSSPPRPWSSGGTFSFAARSFGLGPELGGPGRGGRAPSRGGAGRRVPRRRSGRRRRSRGRRRGAGEKGEKAPPPPPPWRGLDVGSPFDYGKQGILYVARHLPAPGRDGLSRRRSTRSPSWSPAQVAGRSACSPRAGRRSRPRRPCGRVATSRCCVRATTP